MRSLFFLLLFSSGAFAQANPTEDFEQSPLTKEALQVVVKEFQSIYGPEVKIQIDKAQASLLSGGCGFSGCDAYFLASIALTAQVTNAPTKAVIGTVSYNPISLGNKVKILDAKTRKILSDVLEIPLP